MEIDNAIAIVGVGCRFPGAENIAEFWKVLSEGENHVIEVPPDRWNLDAFYDSDPNTPGKTYVRKAGFVSGHDEWDNMFFGISDVEAERMDPQQKFVLDCVHMAAEDGGFTSKDLSGSNTGVYIGVMNDDYKGAWADDLKVMDNYTLTGTSQNIISARVSYVYNLLGPSLSIDTACSSSLVAIHLASQAIRTGDCSMAICGGVNCILYPDLFVPLSRAQMVSPTGQCQAFSSDADGYARGEGCGIVILKKLNQAKLDGNKIWAVIYTGCNQDGRTTSPITAPSGKQQEELLKSVYRNASVDPVGIQYIEAHGTGTPLGDPVEVNALGNFFYRAKTDKKINIGSVKTNIGHLESAAGVAGLIKCLLMMEKGKIVPSLHFRNPNPKINFSNFEVPIETSEWPCSSEMVRMACVNSFGFGGTNAHVIIKHREEKTACSPDTKKTIIAVSAKSRSALVSSIKSLAADIPYTDANIHEVAYASTCKRDHHDYRTAFVVENKSDLQSECYQRLKELNFTNILSTSALNVIFVFCGVGTTLVNMCHKMISEEPVFLQAVLNIDKYLTELANLQLVDVFRKGFDNSNPLICHLSIFACQIGLAAVWKHWGILPNVILGQSVGEVAAAYIAGILSLEDAVSVIFHRSEVLAGLSGGRMVVVGNQNIKDVESLCAKYNGEVSIAVYVSPIACVVSGNAHALENLKHELHNDESLKKDLLTKDLGVQCAYHSHHTNFASIAIREKLVQIKGNEPSIPIVSTVTGEYFMTGDFSSPQYWSNNIRKPVLFMKAIQQAYTDGKENVFVEVGPRQVLKPHIKNIFPGKDVQVVPSMNNNTSIEVMLESLATLYTHGMDPDFENVVQQQEVISPIPRYIFSRSKLFYEPDPRTLKNQGIGCLNTLHNFMERVPSQRTLFRIILSPNTTPYVFKHIVSESVIVPGAFYVEIAFELGKQILNTPVQSLDFSTEFVNPLQIGIGMSGIAYARVDKVSQEMLEFSVTGGKTVKATGTIHIKSSVEGNNHVEFSPIHERCQRKVSSKFIYDNLERIGGFVYGEEIRLLGSGIMNDEEALFEIKLTDMVRKGLTELYVHPAILDALLQVAGAFQDEKEQRSILPVRIGQLSWKRPPMDYMYGYAVETSKTKQEVYYNALLLAPDGSVIVEVKQFAVRYIEASKEKQSFDQVAISWRENEKVSFNNIEVNFTPQCTYVISFEEDALEFLRPILPNDKLTVFSCDKPHTTEEYENSIRSFFDSEACKQEITHIIVLPGRMCNHSIDGDKVLQRAIETCSKFKLLIGLLEEMSSKVPVYVLTEGTQNTSQSNPLPHYNVFGSELWGMVRCILRELLIVIYLIDINFRTEKNLEILKSLLKCPPNASELVIEDGRVFVSSFIRTNSNKPQLLQYKSTVIQENCSVSLKSSHYEIIERPFFVLNDNGPIPSNNDITIAVEKAYIQNSKLFPVTNENHVYWKNLWPGDNCKGYDVIAIEVEGHISEIYKAESESHIRSGTRYISCYPVVVSSHVNVPLACICKLESIPFYIPGLLQLIVLLWSLKCKISPADDVLVLVNDECRGIGKLITSMLEESSNRRVYLDTFENIQILDSAHIKEIICLCLMTPAQWTQLIPLFPKSTHITSVRPLLSRSLTRYLRGLFHHITFSSIETDDIFDRRNLIKVVPEAVTWITTNTEKVAEHTELIRVNINISNDDVLFLDYETVCLPRKEMPNTVSTYELRMFESDIIRRDSCYMVTGGLTGLGWEIVKFLFKRRAGLIVSISRRTPDKAKVQEIEEIKKAFKDSKFTSLSVDVCDIKSLHTAFKFIGDNFPNIAIKGIFHGAGVLHNAMFSTLSSDQLIKVLRPKIQGAWNLHLLSKNMSLDFFILQSSITSLIGNFGQSNYGAANSFLDTLAHYRQSLGLCGQSINWGPLAVGMLVTDSNFQSKLKDQGFYVLELEDIEKCILESLMTNCPQVSFCSLDWNKLTSDLSQPDKSFIFSKFESVAQITTKTRSSVLQDDAESETKEEWAELFNNDSNIIPSKIFKFVRFVATKIFAVDVATITPDTSILSLGVDSMLAMTFVNKLFETTGIRLPIIKLMTEEASFSTVVRYLMQHRVI